MEISLDAVDWTQVSCFETPGAFLEWMQELEDDELRTLSCHDNGWESDSAIHYYMTADALDHLASIGDVEFSDHLTQGLRRIIASRSPVDEFGLSGPSEGCYHISASPETVASIKHHVDAVDVDACVAMLERNPAPDVDELTADLRGLFAPMIAQHARMVDVAVSNDYGLLGHCG